MEVYNFVENKSFSSLAHFEKAFNSEYQSVSELGAAASLAQRPSSCSFTRRTKLSTVSFTDVVVVFTFDIVLNSCILNCFVFSLYTSSISFFYFLPVFGFSESGHKLDA